MEALDWVLANWPTVLQGLGYLYLAATVVAGLTPTEKDDAFLARLSFLEPPNGDGTFKLPGARPRVR